MPGRDSIGSFWLKESKKDGRKYLSGTVTISSVKHEVVIFKNDKGDNPARPDYRMYLSVDSAAPTQQREDRVPPSDEIPF